MSKLKLNSILLVGVDGDDRDRVERGLVGMLSPTRVMIADGLDGAAALLEEYVVSYVIVVDPSRNGALGESIRYAIRARPELRGIPVVVFNYSKNWWRHDDATWGH